MGRGRGGLLVVWAGGVGRGGGLRAGKQNLYIVNPGLLLNLEMESGGYFAQSIYHHHSQLTIFTNIFVEL